MKELGIRPQNKDFFERLICYGAKVLSRCRELGIDPITYGSVAYLVHTGDCGIDVSDIDFLVPESDFEKIISAFNGVKEITVEKTNYHSLKLLNDGYKVSFDAIEHYLIGLSAATQEVEFMGNKFKVVGPEVLAEVYSRGAQSIPVKREAYEKKLQNLKDFILY
jgi:hypothetical protein